MCREQDNEGSPAQLEEGGKKVKQLVIRLNFNSGRTAPLKNKTQCECCDKVDGQVEQLTPTFFNLNVFSWVGAFQSHTQVEKKLIFRRHVPFLF